MRNVKRSVAAWCLSLVALPLLAGCMGYVTPMGVPLPKKSRFQVEWKHYSRLHDNKALAVAGDVSSQYVSGYAFECESQQSAVERALAACETRRTDKRIDAPCQTYAIGNQPLASTAASSGTSKIR
jgi:hypothetical protein